MPRKVTAVRSEQPQGTSLITPQDLEIFRRGAINANYITDFYTRTETSGDYWRNRSVDDPEYDSERQEVWELIHAQWLKDGKPDKQVTWQPPRSIRFFSIWGWTPVRFNVVQTNDPEPIYHHNHGWLFQPWQLEVHHAPQPDATIIGGFGVGKTAMIAMSLAVLAITVPNFRGFAIAPQMIQATEVYQYLNTTLQGTPYWQRFVRRNPERPWPKFIIQNSYVGQSTIEIYSLENDPEKIRTLEGDVAFLDQAEKFENLDDIERDLGSRLRGTIRGRPRIGRMIWIANAGDNPLLWDRFDMGEHQPKHYLSRNPRSVDNPYLSKRDIENLTRRVGGSAEEVAVWLEGKRPMGSGEHFTREMVRLCTDEGLNASMENALKLPDADPRRQGYLHHYSQQLGTFLWEMPAENHLKRDYIVISDPGSSDPPHRNSAIIMAFDVTEFPEKPMVMRGFNWIFGHGSYWPWIGAYQDYVEKYRAYGRNAFDSTGVQKGFDELVFSEMKLAAEGMDMAVGGKMRAINSLKFFMGKGMIKFPYISYLSNQLTNFKLPDNKIRQDLVMCLAMAASWARRLYYMEIDNEQEGVSTGLPGPIERYERPAALDRYDRSAWGYNHR